MIPEQVINDIRDRTDIVAVIGDYVRLQKRGGNYLGLCPFHNEKSPSFNVHPGRRFFHCFGCKASGDAISFLMRIEGLSFPQAARTLAERAGLEIPELSRQEDEAERRARERRERLAAVMEAATTIYAEALASHPLAGAAQAELSARGVDREISDRFRLGFAPPAWDFLAETLHARGHDLSFAAELGLVARRRDGGGYYDRFRNRLQFPVADTAGQVVAFSGRALPTPAGEVDRGGPVPKYINSPEGPLFRKGEVLFGLHEARVALRRVGWAILCEGNFDLLALRKAGFENAVAPLGTAFTSAQAALLARYVDRVTLLFDGDAAGRKAAEAALPLLQEARLAGRVAILPKGEDPDSFLRAEGPEALQARVDAAPGIVEYIIDSAALDGAGGSAAERAAAIQALAPVLASVKNPVEMDLYIQRVAQKFQIGDPDAVRGQLRQGYLAQRRGRRREPQAAAPAARDSRVEQAQPETEARRPLKLPPLQADLLGLLLDQPTLFDSDHAKKLEELLTIPEVRGMFRTASELARETGALDASTLLTRCSGNPGADWLRERLAVGQYQDLEVAKNQFALSVRTLEKQSIESERAELLREIQAARGVGDEQLAIELTRKRDQRLRALRTLQAAERSQR